MNIIDVIPLTFIPRSQAQILSYFHPAQLARGTVVEVPMKSRKIKAVVFDSTTLKGRKLAFKKSVSFELKNITRVINPLPQVFDWQFQIASYLSTYHYAPLGLCLKTVLPPFWGKRPYWQKSRSQKTIVPTATATEHAQVVSYIQTQGLLNHCLDFEGETEGTINRGEQVFLMVPENTSARYFIQNYSRWNPLLASSSLSNKECYGLWQKVASGQAQLIIGTRVGLFLPFRNLGLLIVDDESNEAYKSDMTPRYHAADAAAEVAKIHNAKLMLNSLVPRLETYSKFRPSLQPIAYSLQPRTINMVDEIKAGNFSTFSRELKGTLIKNISDSQNTILYIPRRGHANFILCQTCGQPLTCPNCSASLVPHTLEAQSQKLEARSQKLEARIVCHHCNQSQPYPKQCPACGSYKLKAYGIGIEKVRDELERFFAKSELTAPPVLQFDSDSVKTETQEREIIKKFAQTKPAILLATQMIFGYKYLIRTPLLGIINADALINIPDFRAEESFFRQIYTLGRMTDQLIIQTYNPENPAVKFAAADQTKKFFEDEINCRREFNYPPFSSLVKLRYHHKDPNRGKLESSALAEKLKTQLRLSADSGRKVEIIGPAPAFIFKEKGLCHWLIILKLKSLDIKKRNDLLGLVPNGWLTDVDPKNVI